MSFRLFWSPWKNPWLHPEKFITVSPLHPEKFITVPPLEKIFPMIMH